MMLRSALLILTLGAGPALACAGPPPEPASSPCDSLRVDAAHVCVPDASAPAGYRLDPVSAMDPALPDCGAGTCRRELPEVRAERPVARLLLWLAGA